VFLQNDTIGTYIFKLDIEPNLLIPKLEYDTKVNYTINNLNINPQNANNPFCFL